MIIKIPLTNVYLGTKAAIQAKKESLVYGAMTNNLTTQLMGGGYRVDFKTLYVLFNNIADVKAAVGRTQNAVCRDGVRRSVQFVDARFEEREANQSLSAQRVRGVLDRKDMSFRTLMNKSVRDIRVAGNFYWHILRNYKEEVIGIDVVDPRTMTIIADEYGNIVMYKQHIWGFDPMFFDPDEIIHGVVDYSTENPLLGCSPIESMVWDGRAELASATSNYFFYENSGVPAHLLIVKKAISKDQAEQMKDMMKKEYKGTKNMHKAGFIPYVEDVKTIAPSQKEMQYLESRKFTTKKIAVAFGVDTFLLGYTEGVQRSNGKIIERDFYENTVRPLEIYFQELWNNHLLPLMGIEDVKIQIAKSDYISEDERYNRSRLDVQAGIITRNEARALRGMEPSDNQLADELVVGNFVLDDLEQEVKNTRTEMEQKTIKKLRECQNLLHFN